MKTFHFSLRLYIKNTDLPTLTLPSAGLYTCHWLEDGSCQFDNLTRAYEDMLERLKAYYDMSYNPTILYHEEETDTEVPITDDVSFGAILQHAAQSYSMFSLKISVRAPLIHGDYSFQPTSADRTVNFASVWRSSKPKFHCIREWLLSLERAGETLPAPEQLSYGEKSMLFANFKLKGKIVGGETPLVHVKVSDKHFSTNQVPSFSEFNQSASSFEILSAQIVEEPNFVDINQDDDDVDKNEQTKMLQEKMILDPVISMVLFNEYIPLQRRSPKPADKIDSLNKSMKSLSVDSEESAKPSSVFIKSEPAPKEEKENSSKQEGLFLRSTSPGGVGDDWVIA